MRTLGEYTGAVELLFSGAVLDAKHEHLREAGLELARICRALAAGLLSNSHAAQQQALDSAKNIANERDSISGSEGEVDQEIDGAPTDFGEIALRLVAIENRVDEMAAFLQEVAVLVEPGEF